MKIVPATEENLQAAARAIREGGLVGMPTETVYGVAANALDPEAVRRTFQAKGRPADNPLIVHVASLEEVREVAAELPEKGRLLAQAFWPGPLTLVLPKRPEVPDETTAGLDTVAVRVPAHRVAQALISAAGRPISAPSANPFMGLSPTQADHIASSVADRLELILDGGPCEVGLESTVVDVSGPEVRLLRPGRITLREIEAIVGEVLVGGSAKRRSPGMYPRHYAPRARVLLVESLDGRPGIARSEDAEAYGRHLYRRLHELDATGAAEILIERPPEGPEWTAIWDRLRRATT